MVFNTLCLFFSWSFTGCKIGLDIFSCCMQDLGRPHRSNYVCDSRPFGGLWNQIVVHWCPGIHLLDASPVFLKTVGWTFFFCCSLFSKLVVECSRGLEIAIHILMSGFPVISNFEVEEKDEGTLHDSYLYKHAWAWVHFWTLAVRTILISNLRVQRTN